MAKTALNHPCKIGQALPATLVTISARPGKVRKLMDNIRALGIGNMTPTDQRILE